MKWRWRQNMHVARSGGARQHKALLERALKVRPAIEDGIGASGGEPFGAVITPADADGGHLGIRGHFDVVGGVTDHHAAFDRDV